MANSQTSSDMALLALLALDFFDLDLDLSWPGSVDLDLKLT